MNTKKRKQMIQTFQKVFEEKDLFYNNFFDFLIESYKILKTDFKCIEAFRVVVFNIDFT